ncbi:hypothetical protein BDV27DRAFT_150825 [Aspergillus caelatus]|uniref:Alpha/Beta hydrolase protein n=1 Tax=Aspergillus caelatus TaxID=61420 RepID=A0A5N6ZK59_9EURO|nr:uncharacterized protein BDV27DRAFT_150825 [Aspergillus caelatus]KAE8358011.1 hypothetical protein BDV27DRAFT_150825 [Aspergillus caelatus]
MLLGYDADFTTTVAGILPAIIVAPKPTVYEIEARWEANTAYFADVYPSPLTREQPTFTAPAPAILHMHGGGMFQFDVLVEYWVALEKPYPAPSEGCYAGLKCGIATTGENLVAASALQARSRPLSVPAEAEFSIYPMLDDQIITGWTELLGRDVVGSDKVEAYAAPTRAHCPEALGKVARVNISLQLHVNSGLPYAFEISESWAEVSLRSFANRFKAIARL